MVALALPDILYGPIHLHVYLHVLDVLLKQVHPAPEFSQISQGVLGQRVEAILSRAITLQAGMSQVGLESAWPSALRLRQFCLPLRHQSG